MANSTHDNFVRCKVHRLITAYRQSTISTFVSSTRLLNSVIDVSNYGAWKAIFGQSTGGGALADGADAVPEPAAIVLLAVAALGFIFPTSKATLKEVTQHETRSSCRTMLVFAMRGEVDRWRANATHRSAKWPAS